MNRTRIIKVQDNAHGSEWYAGSTKIACIEYEPELGQYYARLANSTEFVSPSYGNIVGMVADYIETTYRAFGLWPKFEGDTFNTAYVNNWICNEFNEVI